MGEHRAVTRGNSTSSTDGQRAEFHRLGEVAKAKMVVVDRVLNRLFECHPAGETHDNLGLLATTLAEGLIAHQRRIDYISALVDGITEAVERTQSGRPPCPDEHELMCHCGTLIAEHPVYDNHAPVIMGCSRCLRTAEELEL